MSEVLLIGLRVAVFIGLMFFYMQTLIYAEYIFSLMKPEYFMDRLLLTFLCLPFSVFGCKILVSDKFIARNSAKMDRAFDLMVENFFVGIGNQFKKK